MIATEITRRLEFDAAHRVLGHEGKCRNLHGHRYRADISVESSGLDSLGRVVDFSVVKELVGGWIDLHWDHNTILNPKDPLWVACDSVDSAIVKAFGRYPYIMPDDVPNPTAENMAKVLWDTCLLIGLENYGVRLKRIRIYETPNCWADYSNCDSITTR